MTKGIILAGGSGTRLYPATKTVSKQLMAVYDKPMVYYPLSTLMLAGIRDIILISTPNDLPLFERLLGDGSSFGVSLQYAVQKRPEGLAQAFLIAKDFLMGGPAALVLGDNIFYGHGLPEHLHAARQRTAGATVFGYHVADPERYGVIDFDTNGKVMSIIEKPSQPKSNFAVVGLYFYDKNITDIAAEIKPSHRGELEITSVNQIYLGNNELHCDILGRGIAWLDTGTHDALLEASNFVAAIERRQNLKIACLEEIGLNAGWVSVDTVTHAGEELGKTGYGAYLLRVAHDYRMRNKGIIS